MAVFIILPRLWGVIMIFKRLEDLCEIFKRGVSFNFKKFWGKLFFFLKNLQFKILIWKDCGGQHINLEYFFNVILEKHWGIFVSWAWQILLKKAFHWAWLNCVCEFWDGLDLMDLDPFICGFLLCSDWAFERVMEIVFQIGHKWRYKSDLLGNFEWVIDELRLGLDMSIEVWA